MRRALVLVLALALAAPAAAQERRASLPDIEDEIMCVECGTALNLSEAPVADDMRAYIRREIEKGRTKEQIKSSLAAQFGEGVLADPPRSGFNLAVYLVPILGFLLAAFGIAYATRRWRAQPAAAEEPAAPALADDDAKRLERDMAAYDL